MKVHELIEQLKKMPQFEEVKTDNGKFLIETSHVELDAERGFVIIRNE